MDSITQSIQPAARLKSLLPILEWLPQYDKGWLRGDIIAAVTVWALLVPEAMAYAGIAGMPPEGGLYAAPLALLGYAIFGTSRQLNVGPSSTVAGDPAVRRLLIDAEGINEIGITGLEATIGAEHFYPSIQAGVDAYLAEDQLKDKKIKRG